MNFSGIFVRRPVATVLLSIGVALAGIAAYFQLPVSPLPQVDFPAVTVSASMAGANPETMASSVATPLERHLGAIADVTEMTSRSAVGNTTVVLIFGLNRDIDGAARDVQAAINASRADLPTALRSNPTYRKINPADQPILILTLTSATLSQGQLYDAAATVLQQRISQVPGVGDVSISGSSLPAVRVELDPPALFKYGIGLEDVRAALSAANANSPKGAVESKALHWQVYSNDQARSAAAYRNLIVAYRHGAPVRLADVADVQDSVEDLRNLGISNDRDAVLVVISRQPGANIIDTVDTIRGMMPMLQASIPGAAQLAVVSDRSLTIRASLRDVEATLAMSIALVILVVYFFLRDGRATLIPSVAVPISLIGTFGAMYLLGYSLDNLSLMALTIATGFVVDDAIVVMENIVRHIEQGMTPFHAAILGAREVGFTVLSMSLSLTAVFIPILLMGGIVGRFFREFAVTLSVAILVSMVVSLTTTPMMCARLLRRGETGPPARWKRWSESIYEDVLAAYRDSLAWVLNHGPLMMLILAGTVVLNIWLYTIIPKGFFPQQDNGRLIGFIQADQSISFQRMSKKLKQFIDIVQSDPAVSVAVGTTGGGGGWGQATNSGRLFVDLKPKAQRKVSADLVINRLRPKLSRIPGATLFLFPSQEIHIGGRQSNATYQYTLQADDLDQLRTWTNRLLQALKSEPVLTDLNSDQDTKGLETDLVVDRDTASRLGLSASQIDNALYDAFGQRQVSTIYESLNQYHVVMTLADRFWQDPSALKDIYISTSGGAVSGSQSTNAVAGTVVTGFSRSNAGSINSLNVAADAARNASMNAIAATGKGAASTGQAVSTQVETMVPLSSFAHYVTGTTPLSVNHQGQFAAATISFNLATGASLSDAVAAINRQTNLIHVPYTVQGSFQGEARTYQQSLGNEPVLILTALVAIYIVLGILYESYAHPLTILSTLPSAGVGALLALLLFNVEFSLIALIGVFLLIGIVKKNAIMMIDFALQAERKEGLSPRDSIYKASLLRFRPIMMTTMAALLGAVPLAAGFGSGSEMRRPLGISIVGGLVLSQLLTLYTTPVVYLYVDRLRHWCRRRLGRGAVAAATLATAGCAVGPDYHRPAAAAPAAYKELAGWKQAEPSDAARRGAWWQTLGDPMLNELEDEVARANASLAQAAASYEQARELARADRATFWPSLTANGSALRAKGTTGHGGSAATTAGGLTVISSGAPVTTYSASLDATWTPDFWGRVRRLTEADVSAAQASAADLANACLSLQATLATDYIGLRVTDDKMRLLEDAVGAYRRTFDIAQNKYRVGVAARSDVISAQAQLDATLAQQVGLGVQRAQFEHAIAVLAGKAPAELGIPRRQRLGLAVPSIPAGLPSELLERRPDIASAERSAQAANARVGVQTAAYFPDLTLSADGGYEGSPLSRLFSAPNQFWTLGGNLGETIFNFGQRRAQVMEARAAYDASAAAYRQAVLAAFQQVEDQLAALRILEQEAAVQANAVKEASDAARIAVNEYHAGTVDYTTVVTAQVNELTDRESDLSIQQDRLNAAVALMEALGGGWQAADLPDRGRVLARQSQSPADLEAPKP